MFFPISYFTAIFSPSKIFANRKALKWWQILITVIFLNSLILMPVSIHYASLKTYDMERIVDKGLAAITDETYSALQTGKIRDGRYSGQKAELETSQAVVTILPEETDVQSLAKSGKYSLALTEDKWILTYPDGNSIESHLSGDMDLSTLKSEKAVREFVNNQWYSSHKADIFFFLIMVYGAFLYVGTFLVLGAGSVTLYLTRKVGIFDIYSIKEATGLLLNCMGLPSVIAIVAAIFGMVENPILLMNIQIFGTILIMMLVLYKTGFKDKKRDQISKTQ